MISAALYNMEGQKTGEVELDKELFGRPQNKHVLYEAVISYLAGRRRGTHDTKTRAQVRGGGRKPWRQKGTGRSRHGSIRSPIWRGGGIVFGPHPRHYGFSLPRKVRRLALKLALSSKVAANKLMVLEELKLVSPRTKEISGILKKLRVTRPVLLVISSQDENIFLSARNLSGVKVVPVEKVSTYDVLAYDTLLMTKEALVKLKAGSLKVVS